MNAIERSEMRLEKYADIKPPYHEKHKVRLLNYLIENDLSIAKFEELGLDAIPPGPRRDFIAERVKIRDGVSHRELGFNVWLINEIMGPRTPGSTLVYRCAGCYSLRTYSRVQQGACRRCGSRRLTNAVQKKVLPDGTAVMPNATRIGLRALAYKF
jgi:DNA-directed RNA polymerase subunit RPC12/RpoP